MPAPITKIAIAGATGNLGFVVADELVKAGFQVTALTRNASNAKLPAGVSAVTVDYDDLDSLKTALKDQHAVISTLGSQGLKQQQLLIDAALANGLQKIIPSEFGSDHTTAEARASPVYGDKVAIEEYLSKKTSGTSTSYTIVTTNAFLDWGIEHDFLVNVKERKFTVFDGGDNPWTATPLYLIGQAVAGVLRKPNETANREVKVHGAVLTSNSLLKLIQEYSGKDGWQIEHWDTVERSKQAYATLQADPGNFPAWGYPLIFRAAFGRGLITDYSKINDNALLGIKALTDDELRQLVRTSVEKAR